MLSWELWSGTSEEWDSLLISFSDYTIYQSYGWGEHRERFGWKPIRLIARDQNNIVSIAQILLKRLPLSTGIIWIPGGPLGNIDALDKNFRNAIRTVTGIRFIYTRFNSNRTFSEEEQQKLESIGWSRTKSKINSGFSLIYNPGIDEELRRKECSSNWRHNLKRSEKRATRTYLWENPDVEEMIKAYSEMQDYKDLKEQTSREQINSMFLSFKSGCVLVRCDDENGNLLAFRGALILGGKGWDIFAVATPAGRKEYASHAAFWELMRQCALHNVSYYDMGGADPINKRGVYDFKKGTGAVDITYLGEWEYATPKFFGILANRAITLRGV